MDETKRETDAEAAEHRGGDHSLIVGGHRDDAVIEVRISDDALEAQADFHPPLGEGAALTPEYVATVLDRLGVVQGIDWELIGDSILACNLDRRIVRDIPVAKGTAPVDDEEPYYRLDERFKVWPVIPDGEVPRIDYRELSPFILVRKGTILAIRTEARYGQDGVTVRGDTLTHSARKTAGVVAGPNTVEEQGAIVAATDGRLVQSDGTLSVEETLLIKGKVGYGTGHIVFPGDVVIEGQVADGFKVYAGGSIVAKETLDATDVSSKKDLVVAGGIVGRGRGTIKVGGDLRTKFLQNCRTACRGSVYASSAVLNSTVYTMGKLDLGDKGRLVGGEIYAIRGVRAAAIGNESQIGTRVHCGVDFAVQQEIDRSNERLRVLALRDKAIRAGETGASPVATEELLRRIEAEEKALGQRVSDLLLKLDADDQATVEVSGAVYPGVIIEICHVAFFVEEPLKKVIFRLDKAKGTLVHDKA